MSFIKSLAVTAFACAAFMASSTASADVVTAGSAPAVRFTNYNICGNVCGGTAFDNQRRIDMVVNETAPEIWGADQLFLTEVCKYQYDAIDARLKPRGFTGNFAATLSGSASLCKGTDYGIAVFVKGIVLDSTVLDLKQGTESEGIKAPCLKHQLQGRPTWACSAHLYWASNTLRDKEALALAAQAKTWEDAGTPVVLGGDFNATPAEMSYFYSPTTAGYGRFTEVDETDVDYFTQACLDSGVTHCRSGETSKQGHEGKPGFYKIDYILTTAHFTNHKGDVLPLDTKVSDHQMQRGAASWAGCGPAASGLFRRDAAGDVYRHPGTATGVPAAPCKVALGLGGLRLIARDGNELVGVDGNGDLWNYAADASTGTYRNGVKLGSGWQAQNVLLAPGDFSGDAIP
ncbi:MAG TPA: endonuclease/exonuclease/phosphatase family protein, partial [Lysobacter sp.]